ncbi:excisionase family protein [Enterobacter hormaechei]|nr:excisionase family protein [Enterobacter hormaechei]
MTLRCLLNAWRFTKENSECLYNHKAIDQWVESLKKKQPGARQ